MRKVVVHRPGGYERLVIEQHPDPVPQGDEVVVRTDAIGVNYADCCVRWGVYESAKKYVGWPITPGFEFAGEVVAAGSDAKHPIGAMVFGVSFFSAYSSHVLVPSHQVFPVPSSMSIEQAACFPTVYMTAYHATFQLTRIRPDGTVLVHSAAGGVGSALLQMGKIAGFRSVGVVGASHKVGFAKEFGADLVIDKSRQDLWSMAKHACPEGYDAVFDANGYTTLQAGYNHLAPTGKLISYGAHSRLPKEGGRINYAKAIWGGLRQPRFKPTDLIKDNKTVAGFNLSFLFDRRDLLNEAMTQLIGWLDEGRLKPPSVTAFPFEDVANAHRCIESGRTVGKLVLITRAQ